MNRRLLILLLGVLGTVAIGCAVQGQPFEKISSPPGNAVIYVYRPYSYAVGADARSYMRRGHGPHRSGGYHAFVVPAGEKVVCSVQTDAGSDEVEFQTERRSYYVREEIGWGTKSIEIQTDFEPHLNPVDTDKAQTEIQSCVLEPQPPKPGARTNAARR